MASQRAQPVDEINRLIRENRTADYRSMNLALGMRPLRFDQGRAVWEWNEQPETALNVFGILQGGYLALFVDEMMGTAIASMLEPGEFAVTAEVKVSYLRPLNRGPLRGESEVIRRTRSIAFLEAAVKDGGGALALRASATWAIMRGHADRN